MDKNTQKRINYKKYFRRIFGLRIIKTALATSLAIAIAHYFDLRTPLLAGISAVVSMTSSVYDSYKVSINRMLSTIVGALIASFFHYIGFTGFIPIGIGVIIVINVCNYLNWKKSITLACVVFIIIMLYESGPRNITYWQYGINRTLDTSVGLVVGFAVNYLFMPPNRSIFLLKIYKKTLAEFDSALLTILTTKEEIDITRLIDDINEINTELKSIKNDRKMGGDKSIKISYIAKINTQFFMAFGLITQIIENGYVPKIYNENKLALEKYFGQKISVIKDASNLEFEAAFNYYLDDLIKLLNDIHDLVEEFDAMLD